MPAIKKKLTKRVVDSTKPCAKEMFVWDTDLTGFGLRVWPSGKRVFVFQYRTKHRHTRRPVIGQYGAITVEQARHIARDWAAEVHKGGDPGGDRTRARKALSVEELADRYIAEHAQLKKRASSIRSDETLLRLHILPAFGNRKVESLTRADIQRLHHKMKDRPGAANRTLALLSKMLNLAERWGIRPDGSNPCRHVEKYPEHRRERFLSEAELARLAEVITEAERARTELPSVIAAIRLLLFTGARLSEILTLRWDYVDLEAHCLRLSKSKTGPKTVYLSPPALEVLAQIDRHDDNPFVIVGAKPGAHLVNLEKPWGRIRRQAGMEDVRLHDLRHSFASVAAGLGVGLPMIGKLLGHTQAQTTHRYAHLSPDPVKAANERVGAALAGMMQGTSAEILNLPKKVK